MSQTELQPAKVWSTIRQLCALASMLNNPKSDKQMVTLLRNICQDTDDYFGKNAREYFRYALFSKVVPVVADIYRDLQREEMDEDALKSRLLEEVPAVIQKYLGSQSKMPKEKRITDEKIIEHLAVDELTIEGYDGPANTAAALVGQMLGVAERTSDDIRSDSKNVEVLEDDDPEWWTKRYGFMLVDVLRNLFGATDDQIREILKVFGAE